VHEPPLVFWHARPNDVGPDPESEHVCPGAPRIVRLLLEDTALDPAQLNVTLGLAPKPLAVIVLLPGVTESVVDAMPHEPLQE